MKLFISYARVDKPLCKQIVERLEDVHEVWYDKRLHAGQEWWNEIQERLAWCEGFVYLLSPESVASEYCQKEFEIARQSGRHLFPVLIQARTVIPDSLSHIHFADLSEGMEDMVTLLNALTIAERRQRSNPPPVISMPVTPLKPAEVSPAAALTQAAEAMEAENYDHAVFLLKEALQKKPEGRTTARMLQNMLGEAETALEQQTYLREAEREYAPIVALAKLKSTRVLACQEFAEFQQEFPDYDPEHLAEVCAEAIPPKPPTPEETLHHWNTATRKILGNDNLFEWCPIPAGKVTIEKIGEQTVQPFWLAKYPITYAQFQSFLDDPQGFKNPQWWEGLAADADHKKQWGGSSMENCKSPA